MNIYDFKVRTKDNKEVSLKNYKDKVLLIVNTATGCGFTNQYEELEKLYEEYNNKGFEILDFPCDQFLHQAPGTNEEINNFCITNYNTKFLRFAKIDVNGEREDALFSYLKSQIKEDTIKGIKNKMAMKATEKLNTSYEKEGDINWNFTKFLIDRKGKVVKRYSPTYLPYDIKEDIEKLL